MSLKRQGTDSYAGQKENKNTVVNKWCLLQIKIAQIFPYISVMRL
jgi:transcription initiation factor TFIID subunit TAF12